jgi:hypothetical protein
MFRVHHSRVPAAIAAILLAAAAAGCSSGGTPAKTAAKKTSHDTTSSSAYTASQLRSALLTSVNGARPVIPVESGAYGSLPGVKATRQSVSGVKITPAKCASASGSGLSSPMYNDVPATVATFRVGTDGVSEVLLAPPSSMLQSALVRKIPAGCSHYHAQVGTKTYTYSIKEVTAPSIGTAASELNVRASGDASANIWTIIYRTSTMVGAITLVGVNATQSGAESLAKQAYSYATKSLV